MNNRWKLGVVALAMLGSLSIVQAEDLPPGPPWWLEKKEPLQVDAESTGCIGPEGADDLEERVEPPSRTVWFNGIEYELEDLPPRIRKLIEAEQDGTPRPLVPYCKEPVEPVEDPGLPPPLQQPEPTDPPEIERDECHECGMG